MATTGGGAGSDLSGSLSLGASSELRPLQKTLFALIKTSSKKHQKNY